MRPIIKSSLAALLLAAATGAASAQVSVNFVKPEEFMDVPRGEIERGRVLKEFSRYFASFGDRLPAGQQLQIEVLDIDLAGRTWPRQSTGDELRVLSGGADWPHLKLRYTLEENGTVLRSGESNLSDMNYLQRMPRQSDTDVLRYEKRMIDEWFEKTITPKVAAK